MGGRINSATTSLTRIDWGAPTGISTGNESREELEALSRNADLTATDLSVKLTRAPEKNSSASSPLR
jgi:hypothetical protein